MKKLREEVKQAKRKVDEAGERNDPLEDSIRQSYEEILQVGERQQRKTEAEREREREGA